MGVSREVEVLVMSLMYKKNLLNSFLYDVNKEVWNSPMCLCKMEEQTPVHLLTNCSLVENSLRVEAMRMISTCNMTRSFSHQSYDQNCAILNCSRDPNFIKLCVEVVETKELNLRVKINLPRN